VVFELDRQDYRYAFVSGPNRSYLWLLSRTPQLPPGVVERFVERAAQLGFDTEKLIFTEQGGD
jgi:apolipoprotein D and lipocalin family protein